MISILVALLSMGYLADRRARLLERPIHVNHLLASLLIFSAWAYGVVPNYLNIVSSGRGEVLTTNVRVISGTAQVMGQLFLLLTAACAVALLINTMSRPSTLHYPAIMLLLLPFILLSISSITNAGGYSIYSLVYPLVVIALWRAQVGLSVLATVGWLTVFLAIASLALGLINKEIGTAPAPIEGGKVIWDSLLAGPHSHPNVLGLALSLGLPFVPLIKQLPVKVVGTALIAVALVWSGNRNSIFAGGAVLLIWLLISCTRRKKWVILPIIIGTAMTIMTPILSNNAADFSFRGRIWNASLLRAHESPLFGLGPRFYQLIARFRNELGQTAFSGHNAYVHTVTTGGIATTLAVVLLLTLIAKRSIESTSSDFVPALFITGLIFNSWLQNPGTYSGLDVMSYAFFIPMAILLFQPQTNPRLTADGGKETPEGLSSRNRPRHTFDYSRT
ncbi:O-antigen ligase family protein [Rhodococcus sp. KRD175]|uniref:O-antigen ligase family protein n=1 Tax=Rhodococcus sp. KRD175 TaxID=2729729 RepID=UPI0035B4A9C7